MLVPQGWRLDGGFVWTPYLSMQANLLLRLGDPVSGAEVRTLPAQQFVWPEQQLPGLVAQPGSTWNGSVMVPPPADPLDFARTVLFPGPLSHLAFARLLDVRDLSSLADAISRGVPPNITVRAVRLRFAHDDAGQRWEEDVTVVLSFAASDGWTRMWWSDGHTMRAPAGRLDSFTPVLSAAVQSVRVTREWHAYLEQVRSMFRRGIVQEQADLRRLAETMRRNREDANETHRAAWEEREVAQARQNFAIREILGGVDTFTDPFLGRTVELPAGSATAWANARGEYVIGDTAGFDPRVGSTEDWRPLRRHTP
ncbi:hypothetical protein [Embleya sp. NPDC020630]|uniref:hypothetical protein n=1 Tax=Embleya sp. NPDC020630 TaxID=3363979 RepID=UPI0037BD9CDB